MHLCLHMYMCICLHLYLCVFMHMIAGTHMCLHTSLHEHTFILHPCTCVYTQIHVYSHFCVCMCVYMCIYLHADFEPLLKKREHWSSHWLWPLPHSLCHTLPLGNIFYKVMCHASWPHSTEAVTVTGGLWSLQCLSGSDSSLGTSWLHRKIVGPCGKRGSFDICGQRNRTSCLCMPCLAFRTLK